MHQKQPPAKVAFARVGGGPGGGVQLPASRVPKSSQAAPRVIPAVNTASRSFIGILRSY